MRIWSPGVTVLEWELDNLQGDTLDEAAEERRDGEWPPMHSAPAWPFALGRPPVGRCVASAKVPPCAAPIRLALAAQLFTRTACAFACAPHAHCIDAPHARCMCTTALETRKMMLELEVSSGKLEMPAYLARVAASLEAEKAAAKAHKAAGQTTLALHAMRRAKIMQDEIAAARETE